MNAVVGIGDQQHVALVDRRPAADARSVDAEAVLERALVQLADGIRNVVLQPGMSLKRRSNCSTPASSASFRTSFGVLVTTFSRAAFGVIVDPPLELGPIGRNLSVTTVTLPEEVNIFY